MKKTQIFLCLIGMLVLLMAVPVKSEAQELIGLWHFDEGSGTAAADTSGNNNHGTLLLSGNEPAWVGGKFGNALSFTGLNYVGVNDSDSLEPSAITVEAWVKHPIPQGSTKYVISKHYTGGWNSYGLYTSGGGGLVFYIGHTGGYIPSPNSGISIWDEDWHHIAGTFDGFYVRLYVDGNEVGSGTSASGIIIGYNGAGLNISGPGDQWAGIPPSYHFTGEIDEVRIYDGALSDDMIASHAAGSYECVIDIKPSSDPNSINLGAEGNLPVAILGSLDLDVEQIDENSIMLGSAGLAARGKKGKLAFAYDDVNEDGYIDLIAHFSVQDLGLTETTTSLTLIAELLNGLGITGVDSVRIVPPQ